MSETDRRCPLAVVAGYLGAGKTTFLRRYARRIAPRRVAFLVNEFAASDVDTPLFLGDGLDAVGISGGSIFCRCKITDFLRVLPELPARFPAAAGVVVEASGLADPSAAQTVLDEAGLHRLYRFVGTLTLVDPGTLPKVLDTLPAAERQVTAADAVVISKADLHDARRIEATAELVRSLNPRAQLFTAAHGECALDLLAMRDPQWVEGAVNACADAPAQAVDLPCPGVIDADALAAALAAFAADLLRAKGFFCTPAGWRYLDWSAGRLMLQPSAAGPAGIAVIVHPRAADAMQALAARLARGDFAA
ncbi:MAG: GTP-binding protein [Planctomycetota bacterium]|nr:hypothetical protein [Planctomycetota bacterium]MCX8040137.1 hypothetical protein [Planctomycetota bacterium]MDW8373405.1 GTP-binding protein [Planctomycetota bacterium]